MDIEDTIVIEDTPVIEDTKIEDTKIEDTKIEDTNILTPIKNTIFVYLIVDQIGVLYDIPYGIPHYIQQVRRGGTSYSEPRGTSHSTPRGTSHSTPWGYII